MEEDNNNEGIRINRVSQPSYLLGKIAGGVDELLRSQTRIERSIENLDDRVSKLEKAKMYALGVAGSAGVGGAALWQILAGRITL